MRNFKNNDYIYCENAEELTWLLNALIAQNYRWVSGDRITTNVTASLKYPLYIHCVDDHIGWFAQSQVEAKYVPQPELFFLCKEMMKDAAKEKGEQNVLYHR